MDRKRKRQSCVEFWTASKCQRLLRPIASRIVPLRRYQYAINSELSQVPEAGGSLHGVMLQKRSDSERTTSLDPTWLSSDQSRKCQLMKYSVRHRNPQLLSGQVANNQNACLVSLPTPFKARESRRRTPLKQNTTNLDSKSPCVTKSLPLAKKGRTRKDLFTRAPVAKQSVELKGRQNYERTFELHQGVLDGFSLLLQRTCPPGSEQPPRRGASSLLSMCLRRVPDYIRAEEDWRKRVDEDDDTDVAAEVYEELEDLGSVQGQGWSGLREVVIAHGLSLVQEIIKDKLVATEARAELAKIPSTYGLQKASEDLLLAYAHSLPLKRPLGVDSRLFSGCLSSLTDIQPASAENEIFIRILSELFSSGRLKLSWLATRDMATLSSGMIRTLASRSQNSGHIIQFLQGRISQIFSTELTRNSVTRRGPEDTLDAWTKLEYLLSNTTVSIITVLTTIVLIERNTKGTHNGLRQPTPAEDLLAKLSIGVLSNLSTSRRMEACTSPRRDTGNHVSFAVLASGLVLDIYQSATSRGQASLWRRNIMQGLMLLHDQHTTERTQTTIERAASFLVDTSQCCGQSLHSDSQTYVESLVQAILDASEHGSDFEVNFLRQWAMESALRSAKSSATPRSRTFLEKVETAMRRDKHMNITSITSQQLSDPVARGGLQWEEGLCEWIIASPQRMSKRTGYGASVNKLCSDEESDLDDSGYFSDVKETPAPCRKTFSMSSLLASPDVLDMDPSMLSRYTEAAPELLMLSPKKTSTKRPTALSQEVLDLPTKAKSDGISPVVPTVAIACKAGKPTIPSALNDVLVERPAKRKRSQAKKQTHFDATLQLPRASEKDCEEESGPDPIESEVDELAMSCSKPRQRAPAAKPDMPRKSCSKSALPMRRSSSHVVDSSDDELGF